MPPQEQDLENVHNSTKPITDIKSLCSSAVVVPSGQDLMKRKNSKSIEEEEKTVGGNF
jgi:hypothetical protein